MAKVATPAASGWAQLNAEAIAVYAKRAGLNTTELRTRAGMSYGYYYVRMSGRMPFTLNDIESLCAVLDVAPLEVAQMAAMLGKLTHREEEARAGASRRSREGLA